MTKKWIRKGDIVYVLSGNDKGKTGQVLSFRSKDKVVVESVNIRKKHMKKSHENPKGKLIDIECPIHISNVMLTLNNEPVKLKVRCNDGKKELFYKNSLGEEIFYRNVKERK